MLNYKTFARSSTGNVIVAVALLTPVLLLGCGACIDLAGLMNAKFELQSAVDAASLSAIAKSSPAYVAATRMSGDGDLELGVAQAQTTFAGNSQKFLNLSAVKPTYSVMRAGNTISSSVSATALYTLYFGQLFGIQSLPVSARSNAATGMQRYVNFYLAIDVSGSMGLPSTQSEQDRLAALNPDDRSIYPSGCMFACHFQGFQGYALSRNGGERANRAVTFCPTPGTPACIQLRLDAVGYAVNSLLATASQQESFRGQYQVGIYPFIRYLEPDYAPLSPRLSAPSTDASSLSAAAEGLASLLDTGSDLQMGSGGTHFENALPSLNGLITTVGSGATASQAVPFIFLITDGSQLNQVYQSGTWSGSNQATTISQSACADIRNRGVTLGILYIPYIPISNPTSFANGEDFAANANIPKISPALTSCASPGYFFTANTPADIDQALQKMFTQAITTVRITT